MELPFSSLMSSIGILVLSIFVAVNGGKIAAHRQLATRLVTLRGGVALALGIAMLAVGIGGVAYSWYVGLKLGG